VEEIHRITKGEETEMKIMVLNDGETFTSIAGCQIVEVDDSFSTDDIEEALNKMNKEYDDAQGAKILGGFDEDGDYWVGDPRSNKKKKKVKLN